MENERTPDPKPEQSITLTTKQWRAVVSGIVSGIVLVGGLSGSGILRVDKFGHSDYELREQALKEWVLLEIIRLDLSIRKDMPPMQTKMRIRDIERCLEKKCTDFEATMGWK